MRVFIKEFSTADVVVKGNLLNIKPIKGKLVITLTNTVIKKKKK